MTDRFNSNEGVQPSVSERAFFHEGMLARFRDEEMGSCPYDAREERSSHRAWHSGWVDADMIIMHELDCLAGEKLRIETCFQEGMVSRFRCGSASHCPYDEKQDKLGFDSWHRGWRNADIIITNDVDF